MLEPDKIYQGDCIEVMKDIDSESVDAIICDLPYNTTSNEWDVLIVLKMSAFDIMQFFPELLMIIKLIRPVRRRTRLLKQSGF